MENRSTFSILFYIKRTKLLRNGNAPIYLKLTINGVATEASLKRSIAPSQWNTSKNRARGNNGESNNLNSYLQSVQGQLYTYHQKLQETGRVVSAEHLRDYFLGKGEKKWTLAKLFSEHNNSMRTLVGKEYAPLTLQRYETALKHLLIFTKKQYGLTDLHLAEVDNKFITDFEFYLKATAGCQHNSAMKHIKALKKIVRIALANDYIRKDPFVHYRITQRPVNRECLTEEEIRLLSNKELPVKRIAIVRDLFLFQCYTGLAYKDLERLTIDNIQTGIDGHNWAFIKRGKTGVPCHIPLLPQAETILDKYRDHLCRTLKNRLLPVPTNQKMNSYLKEIGDLCGIKKDLHTHLARHTYATTITLSNGIPMETVSRILGHRKLQTTQLYAKVLDEKISKDIEHLRKKTG